MKSKCIKLLILFFSVTFILKCAHIPANIDKETGAPLHGMIYSHNHLPVAGVKIYVDGIYAASSGVNGRFTIKFQPFGSYQLNFECPGYQTFQNQIDFIEQSQVFYIRLTSINDLLKKAEELLVKSGWREGSKVLEKAQIIDPNNPLLLFMQALTYQQLGENDTAEKKLQQLKNIYPDNSTVKMLELKLSESVDPN